MQAAFVSAGGYHHHIGLNTWESLGGSSPPPETTGLYHTAILYPTRQALADALRRVLEAGIQLDGASDHGVLAMARLIASFTPISRTEKNSSAVLSRTTVGFFNPSIKCRPTS